MGKDKLQASRFEQKYIINDETALQVREFVRQYLELDENGVGKPNYSYPVHSLYLDSDDLKLYWRTINGDKNRFKLRLRYYSVHPGTPVFFEIKRRMNNCILKQRGGVRQDAVNLLLAGHLPAEIHLVSGDPHQLVAVQRFSRLQGDLHAQPRAHIFYMREAYVSDNDEVRVTMDREVLVQPNLATFVKTEMENPARIFDRQVILELKFTNRYPDWFRELARVFQVIQCCVSKYAEAIGKIGARRLNAQGAVVEEASHLSHPG